MLSAVALLLTGFVWDHCWFAAHLSSPPASRQNLPKHYAIVSLTMRCSLFGGSGFFSSDWQAPSLSLARRIASPFLTLISMPFGIRKGQVLALQRWGNMSF